MRRSLLLLSLFVAACASYTADYRERLVQSMPDMRQVTFDSSETFPGRVLCGEYTAVRRDGYGQKTAAFIVTPTLTLKSPSDEKRAVFCSDDPETSLFDTYGIGGADVDRSLLETISQDMAVIDAAVMAFYSERGYAPQILSQLLDGDFGAAQDNIEDPWGRPYRFSAGLAGRSLPRFKLGTLGRDGSRGGTGPDADIDNDAIDAVRHVLALGES